MAREHVSTISTIKVKKRKGAIKFDRIEGSETTMLRMARMPSIFFISYRLNNNG